MKGTLLKSELGWIVAFYSNESKYNSSVNTLLLHPDNVKRFDEFSQVFDNIEARIAAYPEVEFEIIEQYAKLK